MKKLLATLKNRAIFGATLALASAPTWAYDPDNAGDGVEDAFAGIAKTLIAVLQGSGGFVLSILAIIGAGISMVAGKTTMMWICIGLVVLLAGGVGAAKLLFGATF